MADTDNPTFPAELAAIISAHKALFGGYRMMADEAPPSTDETPQTPTGPQDGTPPTDDLGDAGKKALDAERRARKTAEKTAAEVQAQLDAINDASKTDAERLTAKAAKDAEQATTATARADRAERNLAVYLNAGDADPQRLLKNVDFLDAINTLEPGDTAGITAAITAAVKDAPWMRKVGATGGDLANGHGNTPTNVAPGTDRMAAAFDATYGTR